MSANCGGQSRHWIVVKFQQLRKALDDYLPNAPGGLPVGYQLEVPLVDRSACSEHGADGLVRMNSSNGFCQKRCHRENENII